MLPDEYVQDLAQHFGLPADGSICNFARALIAEYKRTAIAECDAINTAGADVERYQWIRSVGVRGITGGQLDHAIDMAMAEEGGAA